MKKFLASLLFMLSSASLCAQWTWIDPMATPEPQVQGRGWNTEIGHRYGRLPLRPGHTLRPAVVNLSQQSAGLYVEFYSNAPQLRVRLLEGNAYTYANMAALNVGGTDLYQMSPDGVWQWCAPLGHDGRYRLAGEADTTEFVFRHLFADPAPATLPTCLYRLYLPTYTAVRFLAIGAPEGCLLRFAPRTEERPIVAYGTSITQGASAARPGMAWTNQLGRLLDVPVWNLGFSGNAMLDRDVFDLLSEINARAYIIDCMENCARVADSLFARVVYGVKRLRARSAAPIVLTEHEGYAYLNGNTAEVERLNAELRRACDTLRHHGVADLHLLSRESLNILADDFVEGGHPSASGMQKIARAYEQLLRPLLQLPADGAFQPVRQIREIGRYDWLDRHNKITALAAERQPDVVLIGNSITHYWGGEPTAPVRNGGDTFEQLFSRHRVVNMGCGWDRIENMLWRIDHGELDQCHPSHIFLMAGTNNLWLNTDADIVSGVLQLVARLQAKQPQARIHVLAIYPRRNQEPRLRRLNAALRRALRHSKQVDFTDLTPQLTQKGGTIDESLFLDGLHPNAAGYARIADVLRRLLPDAR